MRCASVSRPARNGRVQIAGSSDRQITRSALATAGAYAALTLILTWPAWFRAASHQLGGGTDPWLFIWTIGWNVHALTTAPWAIFDANIFYPHPNTLAYSEHLIGTVLFAAPVVWITGSQLLATNVVALTSVFLSAWGAWLLGRSLGLTAAAAFLAGVIFAFTPPRLERLDQLHLTTIQWIPFALAYLHAYFQTGRARDLRWAATFFSLQALTSGHGTAMLTLGAALIIAHWFLNGEPLALAKRVRDVGIPGLLLLAPVGLVLIPYLRARAEVGLVRGLDDEGVSAVSWLSSSSHLDTYLLSRMPEWGWLQAPADVYLFPGILPLLLGGAAFLMPPRAGAPEEASNVGRWWRGARGLYLVMLLVTIWMTIGPPLGLWQWVYWVPGLSFIRVPSRFMLLGMLALGVLAAFGFERLTARLRPRARLAAAAVVTVLLAAEFAAMPVDVRPYPVVTPAIDRWLGTQPKPFSVVEIPIPRTSLEAIVARRNTLYMLYSMAHFQPLVQGYSGTEPPGYAELQRKLMLFPDDESVRVLAGMGVTYAAVHMDSYGAEERAAVDAGLARLEEEDRLRLVHAEDEGRVYRIMR